MTRSKRFTHLHPRNPIEKARKLLASILRTKHTATEKRAIRPQQRCLGKSRKEGAHWHAALTAGVGIALIQKIYTLLYPVRSAFNNSAKFRQAFCIFAVLSSMLCLFFAIHDEKIFGISAICTERIKISKILKFPGISQRIVLKFSENDFFEKLD